MPGPGPGRGKLLSPMVPTTLFLALAACTGQPVVIGGGAETGHTANPPSPDTGPENVPGSDTGEPATVELSFLPDGGAFVDSVEVALRVDGGEAEVEYCTADPDQTSCSFEAYSGPVTLHASTILHARLAGATEVKARSFVEVDGELRSFASNIPVLVFWTDGGAPDDGGGDAELGLTVIEPPEGGELGLLDAPSDSGRARLKVRGSSSAGFPKKAYDMELWEATVNDDRTVPLLGLPDNGDWVLYAPYSFDDALIRNPLAFALSNTIGRYAPRTAMVELFLAERGNAVSAGDYLGVYVLIEEIERDENRVDITPLLPDDVAEPEVTGGYIFKIDRTGEGESGFSAGSGGGEFDFQQGFVLVQPSEDVIERQQLSYLRDRLDSLGFALASDDLTDPFTGLGYESIMDVDSFIDHHVVNVVMKNPDAFRLSGYMYQDREGRVTAGPVWDFDRASASTDSRAVDPQWWDNQNETSDCTAVFTFGWYEGLFDIPEFRDRYWARFEALLLDEYSADNLELTIDELAEGLEAPAARNTARWGAADFRTEVNELQDWFRDRHAWMLECIQSEPDPRDCRG